MLGRRQLFGQSGPFGFQGGDHVGVCCGIERLGQGALSLPQHAGQAASPLDHALGAPQRCGQVGLALGRQLVSGALRVGVEFTKSGLETGLLCSLLILQLQTLSTLAIQGAQLGPGHMEAHGPQLIGQPGEGAGGGGLALERTDLALYFSDQVEQALEVLFGGREPALRTLAPAAELEDTGRLFDDRTAILGSSLQDGVEVSLADDDVLLAPDAGVR